MHRPLRRFLILLFLCLVPLLAWRPMVAAGAAPPREGFADLVERVKPAVVHLSVVKHQDKEAAGSGSPDFFEDKLVREFFGDDQPAPRTGKPEERSHYGRGSGFVIDSDGYILTNAHVVARAEQVSVVFADRRSFRAEIVGTDPQSDLALLRIDGRNLPVVAWGDSAALRAGDWAIAVGAPLERVQTVTAGIVSAIGRHSLGISDYEDFIQTDAAINPGNSGGPLVDAQGRVIGVNTAFVAQNGGGSGIGFAVPVNMARVIAERLRADGRVVRGWLGAALKDGDLGDGPATGALVHEVDGSSPARRAGLRQGDVLVALDGAPVTSAAEVRNRIALARPGSSLQVRFLRDGAPQTATVRIGEKP